MAARAIAFLLLLGATPAMAGDEERRRVLDDIESKLRDVGSDLSRVASDSSTSYVDSALEKVREVRRSIGTRSWRTRSASSCEARPGGRS